MTQDNEVVQKTEPVPTEGQVSQGTESPAVVQPTPEEILNQKIADAVTKALAEGNEKSRQDREMAKREIQSAKDVALDAQRRAKLAETALGAARTHLQSVDPDAGEKLELVELRAREQSRLAVEQEEQTTQQATQYQATIVQRFHDDMTQFVTGIGINPSDQRIDWATDAPDLLTRQKRILDSVTKVQKENVKAQELSIDKKFKEATERMRKELGGEDVNSVETLTGGVSVDGIPTDITRFRKWVADLPQAEYEKNASKINQMMREGKIK